MINGCDDKFHPCQALADLVTVYETAGTFENQTLCYVGIHNNVANSLALACVHVGVKLPLVTPEVNPAASDPELIMPIHPGYEIDEALVDSPRSVIYQQAENRLYAQQALMLHLLGLDE